MEETGFDHFLDFEISLQSFLLICYLFPAAPSQPISSIIATTYWLYLLKATMVLASFSNFLTESKPKSAQTSPAQPSQSQAQASTSPSLPNQPTPSPSQPQPGNPFFLDRTG